MAAPTPPPPAPWHPRPLGRVDWITAGALVFGFFLLYSQTRSCAPDEWDSVQFVFALDAFDLARHQPHPPGYPLYIALGHGMRWITGADNHSALTLVGSAGGGLLVGILFVWARGWVSRPAALAGVLAAGFCPAVWMGSIKALSDVPASALLFAVAVLALASAVHRRPLLLLAAAVTAAAAAGLRPQNSFVLAWMLLLAAAAARLGWRWNGAAFLVWILANLAWLVPTMLLQAQASSGSFWTAYWQATDTQFRWRFDQPMIFAGAALETDPFLLKRAARHFLGWFHNGLSPFLQPLGWVLFPLLLGGLASAALTLRRQAPAPVRRLGRFSLAWMAPYVLMIFLFLPHHVRYYIPVIAPLAVLAVAGWMERARPQAAWSIPVLMFALTAPLAWKNHREPAPPFRAIHWLESSIPAHERESTLLVCSDISRHVDFIRPSFSTLPLGTLAEPGKAREIAQRYTRIYADTPSLPPPILQPHTRIVEVACFRRPEVIHSKHHIVTLYRLDLPDPHPPAPQHPR